MTPVELENGQGHSLALSIGIRRGGSSYVHIESSNVFIGFVSYIDYIIFYSFVC